MALTDVAACVEPVQTERRVIVQVNASVVAALHNVPVNNAETMGVEAYAEPAAREQRASTTNAKPYAHRIAPGNSAALTDVAVRAADVRRERHAIRRDCVWILPVFLIARGACVALTGAAVRVEPAQAEKRAMR